MTNVKTKLGLILLCASFLFPAAACADGMVMMPDDKGWSYNVESKQQAFISYDQGVERMILAMNTEEQSKSGAVWLFPVPADEKKVTIDVVDSLPSLSGDDIEKQAKKNLTNLGNYLLRTQIYSFSLELDSDNYITSDLRENGPKDYTPTLSAGSEVTVSSHIEKDGIVSEVITAKSGQGIYNYLKLKNLEIKEGTIPALDQYINKDFSFVVSWILPVVTEITDDDIEYALNFYLDTHREQPLEKLNKMIIEKTSQNSRYLTYADFNMQRFAYSNSLLLYYFIDQDTKFKEEIYSQIKADPEVAAEIVSYRRLHDEGLGYYDDLKGVAVSFPTDKIFFPLIPTSVYDSAVVPATIKIAGLYSPETFKDIAPYTKTGYFYQNYRSLPESVKILVPQTESFYYTRVDITAPSNLLKEDLWLTSKYPLSIRIAKAFIWDVEWGLAIFFAFLLFISLVAGMLAGWVAFRRDVHRFNDLWSFGLLGLFNSFSLLGLIIATLFWRTRKVNQEDQNLLLELQNRGYNAGGMRIYDSRKFIFVPVFSLVFLGLTYVLILALKSIV